MNPIIDVSIIIPTYNRLWCLPKAIESCRHTQCITEIIVVDDGSTDGTWEWLQLQPGLVTIRQDNQGQTYAINKGFSVANGQYVRFLDSDDFLLEGTIDKQHNKAIETGAELVCSKVDTYDLETGEITTGPGITDWDDFLEVQLSNRYGSHFLGMLFSRRLVEKAPRRPDFAFREDRMFLLEVGLLNPQMAIVEGCAGNWVQHKQQMQGNYSGFKSQVANWQHLHIYKRILGILEAEGRLLEEYKKAACTVLWPLAHWIAIQHLPEAADVVKWIYELDPSFKIPDEGLAGKLYHTIGFYKTEKLFNYVRPFKLMLR